jgi:DNA-binding NarL/FixJ family response regulator
MPPARSRPSHARTRPFRIAVLDTQAASREQLVTAVAEIGIEVCVEGPLRQNVVALIHRTGCDAALLGMDNPDGAAVRLMPEIDCPVVLCSKNTGPDMVIAAQKIGAMAFLVQPIRPEQVVPTLALANLALPGRPVPPPRTGRAEGHRAGQGTGDGASENHRRRRVSLAAPAGHEYAGENRRRGPRVAERGD